MKDFENVAVQFAQALVDASWDQAHELLSMSIQSEWPPEKLAEQFRSMYKEYAEGPATSVHFDPQFSMEAWPDKKLGDVGWVYVSVQGEGFVEAVTVIVAAHDNRLGIREIQWGRP